MGAAEHAVDFAAAQIAIAHFARLAFDANDDQIAVHRAAHRAPLDVDVGLAFRAAERAVAVGVHANDAGVIRREFKKRVALASDGENDSIGFELGDGAVDLFARGVAIGQALEDFPGAKQTTAALAKKLDDGLLEIAAQCCEVEDRQSCLSGQAGLPVLHPLHSTRILFR
ncbi:MAG TPA: hypothetical protein VI258_12225 [Rhodanobacteraceae bacterium]